MSFQQLSEAAQLKTQVVLGGGLVSTPWWASTLETVNLVASTIAVVCGAIIGLHGVWKLWKHYQKR